MITAEATHTAIKMLEAVSSVGSAHRLHQDSLQRGQTRNTSTVALRVVGGDEKETQYFRSTTGPPCSWGI
jgi:hypothetical protein